MMYGSWNMTQNGQNFLSFWIIFCPCNPLTTQKIKILKKWKKMPGDIIILQMCTINDNCMIYGSWDKESNGQNFLLFWTTFCLFNPLKTRKIKISWKRKTCLEISPFYTSVSKLMIICDTAPEIWPMTDVTIIFHFGLFLALLLPNSLKNQNLK